MTDAPKLHEYWQCPSCQRRSWTMYPRIKFICPDACMTRAIPISFETYMKPDGHTPTAEAWISIDDPEHVSYSV